MAPANQPISMVSTIDARITPSGSGSVAPAPKIAKKKIVKKKIVKKRTRTSDMAPANQPSSKVSAIDVLARMTPSGSVSVAPAPKIAKKKIVKKRTRTSDMAPANQPSSKVSAIDALARMTPSGSVSVAPAPKIAKKMIARKKIVKKRTRTSDMAPANQPRFQVPGVHPQMTPSIWASLSVFQTEKIKKDRRRVRYTTCANGKIQVDFDPSGNPKGPNGVKFSLMIGTAVSCNAPVNVGKWDDIPEEEIQLLIDRALSMFDIDISKPFVKDWILWRMKLQFECIQEEARREVQNPEMMELISKLGSSNIRNQ